MNAPVNGSPSGSCCPASGDPSVFESGESAGSCGGAGLGATCTGSGNGSESGWTDAGAAVGRGSAVEGAVEAVAIVPVPALESASVVGADEGDGDGAAEAGGSAGGWAVPSLSTGSAGKTVIASGSTARTLRVASRRRVPKAESE